MVCEQETVSSAVLVRWEWGFLQIPVLDVLRGTGKTAQNQGGGLSGAISVKSFLQQGTSSGSKPLRTAGEPTVPLCSDNVGFMPWWEAFPGSRTGFGCLLGGLLAAGTQAPWLGRAWKPA